MNLQTPISDAGRIYTMQAKKLEKLGITTLNDLLFYAPFRYENLSLVSKIATAQPGETVTVQGQVMEMRNDYTRRRFTLQKAMVVDETGGIECLWFNQPYLTKSIHTGDFISIAGRIEQQGINQRTLVVKDYEIISDKNAPTYHTARLVPVYSETAGLSSKWLRNRIKDVLQIYLPLVQEYLPDDIRKRNNLMDIQTALKEIHFPESLEQAEKARKRLSFDELFFIQLAGAIKREEWNTQTASYQFDVESHRKKIFELINSLPFSLTDSQNKAIEDIFSDVSGKKVMNRLIQGDVGSGKTIVAAVAMYCAYLNGLQSMLMAPTEILANQHYKTISQLLEPLGVKIELITGGTKKKGKASSVKGKEKNKKINPSSSALSPDIFIGTHALIHRDVPITELGLVVVDEQQRFGVEQRAVLREKGRNPHFLTMTATPIPRTVFLTMYGDLDMTVLSDMPKGRQIVKTWFVPKIKRMASYEWIKKNIYERDARGNKNQVFIVCPFIEESENMQTVKAAKKEFEHLQMNVFKTEVLGLLHGRMKASEKDEILKDFRDGKIDILVATPVVEVGIDIPNATIMVIEGAERFGLSQLHQLRGRVGRSDKPSFCLLFSEEESEKTRMRLKAMETTYSGAKLAEIDLQLRGAGDVFGTRQHGQSFLKIASFSDFPLIEATREEAEAVLPIIKEFPALQEKAKSTIIQKVTPD